jgi:YegS/Rv2252/BmrU family lipid kinase
MPGELATFNTTNPHPLISLTMDSLYTHVVINPSSSGGKTARRHERIVQELRKRIKGELTVFTTAKPLDATDSTRTAIMNGAELIVVIGGDGTIHEVINGFVDGGKLINPSCQLGIVSSGTAQDSAKGFGLHRSTALQIEAVCGPRKRFIDIGRATFIDNVGKQNDQLFLNECSQGIAAVVVQRFQAHHKWMGGFLGFGITAVATAARHREQDMTVEIDGNRVVSDRLLGVVVANGAYAGGGMHFAPKSKVDDGLFDVVLIHKQSIPSRLINFPRIYFGTHVNLSWISYFQGRSIKVTSNEAVPIEADGEFLGHVPCAIDVLPSFLPLKY